MKKKVCSAEKLAWEYSRDSGGSEARRLCPQATLKQEKIFWICSHSIEYKTFWSSLVEGTAIPLTRPTLTPSGWDMEEQKNRIRISSVGRALTADQKVEGSIHRTEPNLPNKREKGPPDRRLYRTDTHGIKITEKRRCCLQPANGWTFAWLRWPRKMAAPSPLGKEQKVHLISTLVLQKLTLK